MTHFGLIFIIADCCCWYCCSLSAFIHFYVSTSTSTRVTNRNNSDELNYTSFFIDNTLSYQLLRCKNNLFLKTQTIPKSLTALSVVGQNQQYCPTKLLHLRFFCLTYLLWWWEGWLEWKFLPYRFLQANKSGKQLTVLGIFQQVAVGRIGEWPWSSYAINFLYHSNFPILLYPSSVILALLVFDAIAQSIQS